MARNPIRVHMPMFWTRTSPSDFQQINENSGVASTKHYYTNNYLLRRHVDTMEDKTNDTNELSVISVLQCLWFVINLEIVKFQESCNLIAKEKF